PPPPPENAAVPAAPAAAPAIPAAPANPAALANSAAPVATSAQTAAPPTSLQEHLTVAREELVARLSAEIRPERRALLSRSDLAKLVSGAGEEYFVRHAIVASTSDRRESVTDILLAL